MPDGNKNNIFQKFENITGRIQDASLVLSYEFFKNGFCGRKKIKKITVYLREIQFTVSPTVKCKIPLGSLKIFSLSNSSYKL